MTNIRNALTRKFGPLPAWAWALIGGIAIYVYRSRHSLTATTAGTPPADTTAAATPQDPVTLSPGESVYDPNTGSLIGTAPAQVDPQPPVTLEPGERVFDPNTGTVSGGDPPPPSTTTGGNGGKGGKGTIKDLPGGKASIGGTPTGSKGDPDKTLKGGKASITRHRGPKPHHTAGTKSTRPRSTAPTVSGKPVATVKPRQPATTLMPRLETPTPIIARGDRTIQKSSVTRSRAPVMPTPNPRTIKSPTPVALPRTAPAAPPPTTAARTPYMPTRKPAMIQHTDSGLIVHPDTQKVAKHPAREVTPPPHPKTTPPPRTLSKKRR